MQTLSNSHLSLSYNKKERENAIKVLEKSKALGGEAVFLKQGQSFENWREKVAPTDYVKRNRQKNKREYKIDVKELITKSGNPIYTIKKTISRTIKGKITKKYFSVTFKTKEEAEAYLPVIKEQMYNYIKELEE